MPDFFFVPAKVFVNNTAFLHSEKIKLSLPVRHVSRIRLSGGYSLSFIQCFSCLFQVGASEIEGGSGQRGVTPSIDLM